MLFTCVRTNTPAFETRSNLLIQMHRLNCTVVSYKYPRDLQLTETM